MNIDLKNSLYILQSLDDSYDLKKFLLNLFLCVLFSIFLKFIYDKYLIKKNYSNYELSNSIPLISICTYTVIVAVKGNLALSLGLVGALSIVRFRTPIKDPTELTYIFASLVLGITLAVNMIFISFIFTLIFSLYIFLKFLRTNGILEDYNKVYSVYIFSKEKKILVNKLFKLLDENKFIYKVSSMSSDNGKDIMFMNILKSNKLQNNSQINKLKTLLDTLEDIDFQINEN